MAAELFEEEETQRDAPASDRPGAAAAVHEARVAQAASSMAAGGGAVALRKETSNLFRDRDRRPRRGLDLSALREVLQVAPDRTWVDVEGMATYETIVRACLARRCMPAVVPQLRTITAGGALAGVGIEATSFRHGLVHHTVRSFDVLLGGGDVVHCRPDNAHADLFAGFPNSYGSLGYAVRIRLATIPVQPFVHATHRQGATPAALFEALERACAGDADFVDAVAFHPRAWTVVEGRFVRGPMDAPSDYTGERIYWRSLQEREQDDLSAAGYLWRWDPDWFWCSRNFGAQRPWVRRLLGRARLNSATWQRWMRAASRWHLGDLQARLHGCWRESVIQDVDIPLAAAPEFLAFLAREIGIWPVWICPVRGDRPGEAFPLYPMRNAPLYVNFGFWDALVTRERHPPGHFNRLVEREVGRLGGIKSLYSQSWWSREEFAANYGGAAYARLKARYDPGGRLAGMYEKCVLRA